MVVRVRWPMPRRGFVLVQTGLNDRQWSRVQTVLDKLEWSAYRLVKTAVLEYVRRIESGEISPDELEDDEK